MSEPGPIGTSAAALLPLLASVVAAACGGSAVARLPELMPVRRPAGRVAVVVAHQDDEVFIAARLAAHVRLGDSVCVIWTAISSQEGEEYARRRVAEARAAMALLGIPAHWLHFLGHRDGSTHRALSAIARQVGEILTAFRPDVIYTPAYEAGHVDHDVAHVAAVRAMANTAHRPRIFEFPLYSSHDLVWPLPFKLRSFPPNAGYRSRELSPAEARFVRRLWDLYPSQRWPFGCYVSITSSFKRVFEVEYLRPLAAHDYLRVPVGPKAAYENFLDDASFEDFQRAYVAYAGMATAVTNTGGP